MADGDIESNIPEVKTEKIVNSTTWKRIKPIAKVVIIFIYFGIGVAFYNSVEKWSVLTCVYFITVSFSTVGYGDLSPTTDGSKMFTIFYLILGLGVIFNIVGGAICECFNNIQDKIESFVFPKSENGQLSPIAKISITLSTILLCISFGALYVKWTEDFTTVDAIYWSFITCTTVGFGDIPVDNHNMRIFACVYIFCFVSIMAGAIGNITGIWQEMEAAKRKRELLSRRLDVEALQEFDEDGGGDVSEVEFLVAMLKKTTDLNEDGDINVWLRRFRELDVNGDGRLSKKDLISSLVEEAAASPKKSPASTKENRLAQDDDNPKKPLVVVPLLSLPTGSKDIGVQWESPESIKNLKIIYASSETLPCADSIHTEPSLKGSKRNTNTSSGPSGKKLKKRIVHRRKKHEVAPQSGHIEYNRVAPEPESESNSGECKK